MKLFGYYLRRYNGVIIFALSLLAITLAATNLWRYGLLSSQRLEENKDALASLSSIATLLVLTAGSIFSYYSFFRGRTLALRVSVSLEVTVHKAPNGYYLHALTMTAKNVGGSMVWEPVARISIRQHLINGETREESVKKWSEERSANSSNVIEPGEEAHFFVQTPFEHDCWAVTYLASVAADTGDRWHSAKTISNDNDK